MSPFTLSQTAVTKTICVVVYIIFKCYLYYHYLYCILPEMITL